MSANSLRSLRVLVLDVDGVMTDGRTWQDATGAWRRCFSVRDAMGLRSLRKSGIGVAILTSAISEEIRSHAAMIGADFFMEGCTDKLEGLQAICKQFGCGLENCGFVSDDSRDVAAMSATGFFFTVPTADQKLKSLAVLVSQKSGGDGAVLEICNYIRTARSSSSTGKKIQAV